ncbi:MAG TPA: hypothetical protein VH084_11285 [Mycobacterium sp.]|nr:hypothetical protein [Mycobacterium sp.]
MHGGRLYYAVAAGPQVWSVGINDDGSFGSDPRWEFDVTGLPSGNEVANIVFDSAGRMILAQRGPQVGSYDYSVFADPASSSVVRYRHEFPDDPTTPSTWVETPDSYAVGFAPDGQNADGGIALGYGYAPGTQSLGGACNAFLWSTGDSLRDDPAANPPLDPPAQVAGLQGNDVDMVRPQDDPPAGAYFTDYDGNTDDTQAALHGHVGAVAIWQTCEGVSAPPAQPAPQIPPPNYVQPPHYNLTLHKWAKPYFCFDAGADWSCHYTIRVENTGTVPYWGPVVVEDWLPDNNPGAVMHFSPQPPWNCTPNGSTSYQCSTGFELLFPGDSVDLHESVHLPKAQVNYCDLPNAAQLDWFFFGHDDNPSDDFGFAVAGIKAPTCNSQGSDLLLKKFSFPKTCADAGTSWACSFAVAVENLGPGNFSGPIKVVDTLGVNAPATTVGPWACGQVGAVVTCNTAPPPVNVGMGWSSAFVITAKVKKNIGQPLCSLDNKANIQSPAGGSPSNTSPGDDFDHATDKIPDPLCALPQLKTDIKVQKTPQGCIAAIYNGQAGYLCSWKLTVSNVGLNTYIGPLSFSDTTAGATENTLKLLTPACSGPPTHVTCTAIGNVNLGAPIVLPMQTFYNGGPSVCTVTNTVSVVTPTPGSATNPPGNDSVSISQPVPNPGCNTPGAAQLSIAKTATGCASDPHSSDWLCDFDVVVTNSGSGAQPAPIKVHEQVSLNRPTTFTGASCAPLSPGYLCTRSTPLNAGNHWTFHATVHVNPNSVSLADCDVVNTVHITTPFAIDPGYLAQASEKVPQLFINNGPGPVAVYCDPPSLKLAKAAGPCLPSGNGYDCPFTITATSTGPDPYHGTVELDEVLPGGTNYVNSSWTCVPTTGNDVHCSSPPVDLAVGTSTSMHIVIHVPRSEAIRSQCAITNTVNASISAAVLHSSKGAQYTASATARLPADACNQQPACPRDQSKPNGCCDPGLHWDGRNCVPNNPPPPPVKPCPHDSQAGPDGSCSCLPGTHGDPGRCRPDAPPCNFKDSHLDNGQCVCLPNSHGDPGHCQPDQPPCTFKDSQIVDGACLCLPNTHGTPGRCQPDAPPCNFRDSHVVDGECVCLPRTHGTPGQCQPDGGGKQCPEHSTGTYPDCSCDQGFHMQRGICAPDRLILQPVAPKACGDHSKGTYPDCACLRGYHHPKPDDPICVPLALTVQPGLLLNQSVPQQTIN